MASISFFCHLAFSLSVSFCAISFDASWICGAGSNSSYGPDSPLGWKLRTKRGGRRVTERVFGLFLLILFVSACRFFGLELFGLHFVVLDSLLIIFRSCFLTNESGGTVSVSRWGQTRCMLVSLTSNFIFCSTATLSFPSSIGSGRRSASERKSSNQVRLESVLKPASFGESQRR